LDRAEWFQYFLKAARAPVVDRPSGPAVDRAEWLSVFLAAASVFPPDLEGTQGDTPFGEEVAAEGHDQAYGPRRTAEGEGEGRTRGGSA
jgi:hypothetical protein